MAVARVPEPREWLLKKRCPQCGKTKPWAAYSPRAYWPDGSVRGVQAWCRECQNGIVDDRRKRYGRRHATRIRARKTISQRRLRAQLRKDATANGSYVDAGPFKAWLRTQKDEPGDLVTLSERAGLHPDTLDGVLRRKRLVALYTVDAALTVCGMHVRDLYPDEYERAA